MTHTLAEAIAYGPAHPYRDNGTPWAPRVGPTWCEAFVHQSGGFTQAFPSAHAAALNSGPLNPDPTTAQPGEIHYFNGENGLGHDGWQFPDGFYCASESFWTVGGLGYYHDVHTYLILHPGFTYMGHTFRHGTETLASLTPSGGGNTPLTPNRSNKMWTFLYVVDSTGPLWTLINMQTAGIIQTRDQAQANSLAITSGLMQATITNVSTLLDAYNLAERNSGNKIHSI